MKNRFTTLDLISILPEIKEKLIGNRVYQVYDVDNKTFLIRFSKPSADNKENIDEETFKQVLILESAIRIHLTDYDWPKSSTPSGFTMKLRKHLRNKRLESIKQIGNDRIVDLQFGTNEFANHIILELYSKGNIILTDKDYVILNLTRVYKDPKTNINIAVREKYPLNREVYIAEQRTITRDKIVEILKNSKEKNFKKIFNPHFLYGANLLEHSLLQFKNVNANNFKVSMDDVDLLEKVFQHAHSMVEEMKNKICKGYVTWRKEQKNNSDAEVIINDEFHPFLFQQYLNNDRKDFGYTEFPTFNHAVDVFFSSMESQKIESKVLQQEKQAMKKLDIIKKDHESRLENLSKLQELDNQKARLIENNIELVDSAISVLRSAIANKYSWEMIQEMVKDAQDSGDPIASKIKDLKLEKNCFSMFLDDPYEEDGGDSMMVDIDIDLSAYSNARKYYEHRKDAAKKEQKTLDHTEKVFKNVEKKVKQQLKESTIKSTIVMAKKTLWFEKFLWFISSEGYLVIAGRDAQQNELIVKRYLNKQDIYVHADMHGATSVVIKNHWEIKEIPPKTINEAANLAVCFSASWDAKVVAAAYWVHSHQVQKTAPSGQYLSVGSFMIRGKKNYIPLQNLILGFGILFRIDDESLEKRRQQHQKEENHQSKCKETEEGEENEKKVTVSFPDTTIQYKDLIEEQVPKAMDDDNDYTIVNTGENIKKKIKVITQRNVAKKVNNEKRKDKKNAKHSVNGNIINHNKDHQEKEDEFNSETNANTQINQAQPIENLDSNSGHADNDDDVDDHDNDDNDNGDNNNNNGKPDLNTEIAQDGDVEDDDDDEETAEELSKNKIDYQRILSSLVSDPTTEDNLLYALPVCGPYAAMQSYKYKLKFVPGQTRRGKASKTALMIFLKEKNATDREKDLLKAIKDQDISKNMPAKVKLITRAVNK